MSELPEIAISIEGWTPAETRRGALRGHVTFLQGDVRLHSWAVFSRDGHRWAYPPGRPRIGADGAIVRHRETGLILYSPTVSFVTDAARQRFERSVVNALLRIFPHALDEPEQTDGDAS